MKITHLIAMIMLVGLLAACGDSVEPLDGGADVPADIDGQTYTLQTLNGDPVLASAAPTITIGADNAINGSTGCNEYGGRLAVLTADEIQVGEVAVTEMACLEPDGVMEQERAFLDALNDVDTVEFTADGFVMTGDSFTLEWGADAAPPSDSGAERMSFAGTLPGTQWSLMAMMGDRPLAVPTITFTTDQVRGTTGCNDFGGAFEIIEGNAVRIGVLDVTEMACQEPEGIMAFEQTFLTLLPEVTQVEPVEGDQMAMLDEAGNTVLLWALGIQEDEDIDTEVPTPALGGEQVDTVIGTDWRLVNLNGEPPISDEITLSFEDGNAGGSAGCNSYGGEYTLTAESISFGELVSTMMACPDVMDEETTFLRILREAQNWQFEGDQLTITAGEDVLVFEPMGQGDLPPFVGRALLLQAINGERPNGWENNLATLRFTADGQIEGNTGCNTLNGTFNLQGNQLTIGTLTTADEVCADPIMEDEAAILRVLEDADRVEAVNGQIAVVSNDEERLLFSLMEQSDETTLEGTEWVLTTLIEGDTARTPLAETTITLFLDDGGIAGSAGCNQYNTAYTLDEGGQIGVVPEIATTRRACEEPIMTQEREYLDLLGDVTRYEVLDDTLTLITEDGRALVYNAR